MKAQNSYNELNKTNNDLSMLIKLTQTVHKSSTLDDIYSVALDLVMELENVDLAMIYLVDEERREAVLQAHRNLTEDYIKRAGRIPYPKGLTWKAINSGRIINIEDAQKDPTTGPAGRSLGHHSNLGIPIVLEEKVIGVIWFGSYKERRFDEREVNLLSTLGDQFAIAIAKAKRTKELEQSNWNLSILSKISQEVHQSADSNQIYRTVLDVIKGLEFVDLLSVYLVEGEGDRREAVLQVHKGYPEEYLKRASRIPYGKGSAWKTITSGEAVFYEDASDPSTPVGPAGKALGKRSLLSIPVKSGNETIGTIDFSSFKRTRFTQQEMDFLFSLGNQIGTSIAKAKMFEETNRQKEALNQNLIILAKKNKHENIISTVTRSVHRSINLQEVLENAVEALSKNIEKVDLVGIYMVEGEEAVLKAHKGFDDSYIRRAGIVPYPKGFTWSTIIEGKPRYCSDVDQDKVIGPAERDTGIKSYVVVPVTFEGKTVGMLDMNSFQKNAFTEEELKLLEIVAGQIEIAINNAQQAEVLRQSEERYRTLFDQSPVGVYIFDKNFKVTQWNERFIRILQSSYDKVLGLDLLKIKDQSFTPAMKQVFEGQSIQREGLYEATTSSAKLWLSVLFSPLLDDRGNVVAGMAVVEDITERKQAEANLKKSLMLLAKKNRYETIVRTIIQGVHQSIELQEVLENAVEEMSKNIDGADNVSIYLVEGEEAIIKAYRGYSNWFIKKVERIPYPNGFTWKTILEGKPIYCADTDKDTVIGSSGREIGTKSYASMPIRFKDKPVGSININSLKKNAFDEEELKLLEVIAQQIEVAINNAQQAEALRQSEERYRTLFDQSPVGVYIFDRNYKIIQCNERLAQILQMTVHDIIGIDLQTLGDETLKRLIGKVLEGQLTEYKGFYKATYSPANLWIYIQLSPLRDVDGVVIGGMAVIEDITKRKQAEERLNDYTEQLQTLSHRLMSAQEEERRNIARELHDEVGQVLTVVKINLQNIQHLIKNNKFARYINEGIAVVDNALEQIRNISLNLRPPMLDDLGLIATLRWFIDYQVQRTGFTTRFNTNLEQTRLYPDVEIVCFRIVQEALTNVARHAQAHNVDVELKKTDTELKVTIHDDGVGFDVQGTYERAARGESSGLLGMQERVRLVGGQIRIESKPMKGTTVCARFPLRLPLPSGRRNKRRDLV
ncbi:MAG TPA: GAF domain-containing protein [Thermodesulfobacteriota bacterium]|nr:GAF domain-containing protein [Thermodesulfobacteriota bacterium]